jgi:5'-methylthioadenosine phosphorylase
MLAIIGGSGLTQLSTLAISRREVVRTPYGEPSAPLLFGSIGGRPAVFLARHGHGHTIPPHRVNYRANLWALKARDVTAVLAVASVGGIRDAAPGALVLPHQIIDYTSGRMNTFFDGEEGKVVHVDFTRPYSTWLRARCVEAAAGARLELADGGVYGAVNGPRLESAAEIDRMDRDGSTLVGMTGMPEAVLGARARPALRGDLRRRQPRGRPRRQRRDDLDAGAARHARRRNGESAPIARPPCADCDAPRAGACPMIRDVLKMGDPRLWLVSDPVERVGSRELDELLADMRDTMNAHNGAGLAAPQIGVPLRVVIFGVDFNPRYPDAEPVPYTELVNPVLTPLTDEVEEAGKDASRCPGLRGVVPRYTALRYEGFDPKGNPISREVDGLPRARRAARVRPPRRHPLPDAHARHAPLRLHRGPVPRQRGRRGLSRPGQRFRCRVAELPHLEVAVVDQRHVPLAQEALDERALADGRTPVHEVVVHRDDRARRERVVDGLDLAQVMPLRG